jgi:phage terminase small subunit
MMARKSAESLQIVAIEGVSPRLEPPKHLSSDEATLFRSIVSQSAPTHFQKGDAQLLAVFVQSVYLTSLAYESALQSPKMLADWEKAARTMISLARQLRLSPISRSDPKTLARAYAGQSYASYPDLERIAEARAGTGTRDWKARG